MDRKRRRQETSKGEGWVLTQEIFILRNILGQANESRDGLYALFVVDFEKAFDSVHNESLWNIMRSYGKPEKMVRVIAGIYVGFECTVVDESVTSDWFIFKSEQGRMMSGF